jgi:hypothetical protein
MAASHVQYEFGTHLLRQPAIYECNSGCYGWQATKAANPAIWHSPITHLLRKPAMYVTVTE